MPIPARFICRYAIDFISRAALSSHASPPYSASRGQVRLATTAGPQAVPPTAPLLTPAPPRSRASPRPAQPPRGPARFDGTSSTLPA